MKGVVGDFTLQQKIAGKFIADVTNVWDLITFALRITDYTVGALAEPIKAVVH